MTNIIDYPIDESKFIISTNNKMCPKLLSAEITDLSQHLKIIKSYNDYSSIHEFTAENFSIFQIKKTFWLNFRNLHTINLSNNHLIALSKSMFTLVHLQYINLDNNRLSHIPSQIAAFANLEYLSLNNNNLSFLPNSLIKLKNLKYLYLNNNKLTFLPIELGLMKELTKLGILCNYIEQLPTTLSYLDKLNEIQFDWFNLIITAYLDNTSNNNNNSGSNNINRNIQNELYINTMKLFKDLLSRNALYCDMFTFFAHTYTDIAEDNEDKYVTALSQQFMYKAIEKNYKTVVRSFLKKDNRFSTIVDTLSRKKTPLYYAISLNTHQDIINMLFNATDFSLLTRKDNLLYLSKAIKTKNTTMIQYFMNSGNSPFKSQSDFISDSGMTPFHHFFSAFNDNDASNVGKYKMIGDLLFNKLDSKVINNSNNEKWSSIHVAARRSSYECFIWIINKNTNNNNKQFILNIKGKDNWTPLHLVASSGNVMILKLLCEYFLSNGFVYEIFSRTANNRTPKQVCNDDKVTRKLLMYYEQQSWNMIYRVKYMNTGNDDDSECMGNKKKMVYTQSRANINFYKEIFLDVNSTLLDIAEAINNLTFTMLKPIGRKVSKDEFHLFVDKTINELNLNSYKTYLIVNALSSLSIQLNIIPTVYTYDKLLRNKNKKVSPMIKYELRNTIKVLQCLNNTSQMTLPKPKNSMSPRDAGNNAVNLSSEMFLSLSPVSSVKNKKMNVINLKNFANKKKDVYDDSLDSGSLSPKSNNRSRNANVSGNEMNISSKFDVFHNNIPMKTSSRGINITNESCNIQDSSASIIKIESNGMMNKLNQIK